jgi:hypothetical protein
MPLYVEEGFSRRPTRRKRAWERNRYWKPKRSGKGSGSPLGSDTKRKAPEGGAIVEPPSSPSGLVCSLPSLVPLATVGPEPEPEAVAEAVQGPEPEPEPVALTTLAPAPVCGEGEPGVNAADDSERGWIEMEVVSFPRNPTLVFCRPVGSGRTVPWRLVHVGWAANFKLGAKLRVIPGGHGERDVWQRERPSGTG